MEQVQQKSEMMQSAVSYGVGGGAALTAWVIDKSDAAQAYAIWLGLAVVVLRFLYDVEKYISYKIEKHRKNKADK